jgi:hypothetical protein
MRGVDGDEGRGGERGRRKPIVEVVLVGRVEGLDVSLDLPVGLLLEHGDHVEVLR